jgi:hypothetical protein
MSQARLNKRLWAGSLMAGMALFGVTDPAWALFGRWAAAAVVVGATRSAEAATVEATNAAASQQAAATANAQAAANAAAAAAQQSAVAAQEAAARAAAAPPAPAKTPQQKLAELQSLYDQKLITQSDYQAAKTKILNSISN